jgi:hypothetical protein
VRLKLKLQFSQLKSWQKYIAATVGLLLLILLLSFSLFSLPPQNNPTEQAGALGVDSISAIKGDITFAPQKIIDFALLKTGQASPGTFRLASVFFSVISAICLFILLKLWISRRIALMGVLMYSSSSWVLHNSHWGEFNAMLLLIVPVLLLAGTMLKIKEYDPLLPLTSFLTAIVLYIPGVWVFVLAGALIVKNDLTEAWKEASIKARIVWAGAFLTPLLPLAYGLAQNGTWLKWLGAPQSFSLRNTAENLMNLPGQLAVNGISDSWRWLPGTPILDIVTLMLAVIGLAYVLKDRRFPIRRSVLAGMAMLGVLFIALLGSNYISIILPLFYVFGAFGIAFLLQQWFHIFPLNPMARSIGIFILSAMIILTSGYHVARYYYVWPRAHDTSHIFTRQD